MPLYAQHLLVAFAVLACAAWVGRSAWRALQGRKSTLAGCGSCGGCKTPEPTPSPVPNPTANAGTRTAFIPVDALRKRR